MTNIFQNKKSVLKDYQDAFKEINLKKKDESPKSIEIPDDVFFRCTTCGNNVLTEEFINNIKVCPSCGFHHKITSLERITLMCDSFEEMNPEMLTKNAESFEGYKEKLDIAKNNTGINEAIVTGIAEIYDVKVALAAMDSFFMMGSMGSVVGEKLTLLIEEATLKELPLIIFSCSGGARMQEGIISLMQMVKTSQALARFKEKGLYISVLTHPTTGGVSASFASLGDITIAEPKTLIGFAGKRVIENTIKETLPDEFQTSEFLLEKGFIDMIVERKRLKDTIYKVLKLHNF